MSQVEKGALYVVATPIGNLDDISRRAISVLAGVDAIAAEDTRHSRKLLRHLGLATPLFALHEHNESEKTAAVVNRLRQGETIALVSDAGTPLISDPGYVLVSQARAAGIKVIPIPGASSILAALSCSGLPTDRFVFEGFLPARSGQRKNRLEGLAMENRTLVFFEAPHRIMDCLQDVADVFGDNRQAVLARELTKTYETILSGTLAELVGKVRSDHNQSRGELVLLVAGAIRQTEVDSGAERVLEILMKELPLKQAASLAAQITGIGKNKLYDAGLRKKDG